MSLGRPLAFPVAPILLSQSVDIGILTMTKPKTLLPNTWREIFMYLCAPKEGILTSLFLI